MIKRIRSFLFENTNAKQTITKNSIWLTISNIGGRIIKAAIIIYAARVLGTVGYGVLSYALALAGFFTLFVDPGINAILTRESAKATPEERRSILSTTLVVKLALIGVGVLAILFIAPWFSTLPGTKELLPLMALVIVFDTMREFLSSFMRSMEKMEWEAFVFITTNTVITIAGFIFLFHSPTPRAFAWAYVIGCAVGAVAAILLLRRMLSGIFKHFSFERIGPMIRAAWPFAVTGALGILLTNTDVLIISVMRSAGEVGIYSAAIRIVQVLYLLPTIIQFSTLPLFSRLAVTDKERFQFVFERVVSIAFMASIPITIGGIILGTPILGIIFGGAFSPGGLAFKILLLTLLFDFSFSIISAGIFAYNHQRSLIITSAIAGISNVAFDILLIPPYGMVGSAIATLIASVLSNWYLWHIMRQLNPFSVLPHLQKVITAGVLMGVVTVAFYLLHVNTLVNILVSSAAYFLLLYRFREPLLIEIKRTILGSASPAPQTSSS